MEKYKSKFEGKDSRKVIKEKSQVNVTLDYDEAVEIFETLFDSQIERRSPVIAKFVDTLRFMID